MSIDFTSNIENIKVGDVILSFDEPTRQMKPDRVTEIFSHPKENNYLVINGHLKVTPVHPVLSAGHWRAIGELKVGDVLTDAKGENVLIVSIIKINETADVFNFEPDIFNRGKDGVTS